MGIARRNPFSLREKPNRLSAAKVSRGGKGSGWRTELQYSSRQRIVSKIVETLRRHLPFSGEEGLNEIRRITVSFEERIYTIATSQSDYLRKISLKMLSMESRSQNARRPSLPPNTVGSSSSHPGTD